MIDQDRAAIVELCIMASLADAANDDRERSAVKRIADTLSRESGADLAAAYEDILLGKRSVEEVAARITTSEGRQLAYEMAVVVCDADGAQVDAEKVFLERLRAALGLAAGAAGAITAGAEAIAATPLETVAVRPPPLPAGSGGATSPATTPVDAAALDEMIERHALIAGALELLPQSLATMAILPLQMKLVYAVGKAHGVELDEGHVKELLATAGAGLASQYVERFGRKLLGGILRGVGGRVLGGVGQAPAGAAITFGTTWAIGQLAKRYYSAGRRLDADALRETFESLVAEGRALGERYVPEMQRRASGIDPSRLAELIRQV